MYTDVYTNVLLMYIYVLLMYTDVCTTVLLMCTDVYVTVLLMCIH